jgi:hypothetical protein
VSLLRQDWGGIASVQSGSVTSQPAVAFSLRVKTSADSLLLRIILLVVLILIILGSLPLWPYSTGWGYYPSGGFTLLLVILLVLALR